ncbi:MAG: transcriptional regulator, partial [Candidatus Bathyarchaeia archaeon]
FIKEDTVVPIKERADIIVVGAGGYPKDSNLSSGVEALVYASKAVKKGGVIILLAECSGGYGEKGFYEWMTKFKSLKDVEKAVKKNFEYGGDKAYCLLKVKELASLRLVSALPNLAYSD